MLCFMPKRSPAERAGREEESEDKPNEALPK
jgi:hypothetical protein